MRTLGTVYIVGMRILFTDHGRPAGVLISPEDAEEFARLEAADIAREIAAAKVAGAASQKPLVAIGDITAMSFKEFDAIVTEAADDA